MYPIYPNKTHNLSLFPRVYNSVASQNSLLQLWHSRLGHPNHQVLSLALSSLLPFANKCINILQSCTHCLHGKMHRLPFGTSKFVANSPFELVRSDLWGPTPNSVNQYVIFVDHFTKFTWLYLLVNKSKVFTKFQHFKSMVEKQFSTKIKTFRSDGGGEYTSHPFK